MKKICVFLTALVIITPVFAQEWDANRKMALTINPFPIISGLLLRGIGIEGGFEYAPVSMVSIKADVYYFNVDPSNWNYTSSDSGSVNIYFFRASLEGRWYPLEEYVKGFFLNGGLFFHQFGVSAVMSYSDVIFRTGDQFDTIGVYAGIGTKKTYGNGRVAFVFEPTLDFAWPLYSDIPFNKMDIYSSNYAGWYLGVKLFRAGIKFGIAF